MSKVVVYMELGRAGCVGEMMQRDGGETMQRDGGETVQRVR